MTRIYTRCGDDGAANLGDGQRRAKDDPRFQAVGAIDELNSFLGVAAAQGVQAPLPALLSQIQNDLCCLAGDLSFPAAASAPQAIPRLSATPVHQLEKWIDELSATLAPLNHFILPGGVPSAARLHAARAICRRAEREVVTLARTETINPQAIPYLNRLADALFVMARFENARAGISEPLWKPES